jgi:hypothetical protein
MNQETKYLAHSFYNDFVSVSQDSKDFALLSALWPIDYFNVVACNYLPPSPEAKLYQANKRAANTTCAVPSTSCSGLQA